MVKIKTFISLLLIIGFILSAIPIFAETPPPPPVSGFSGNPTSNSVLLSWTTPAVNNLAEFEIRYSQNPINEVNFYFATQVANPPAPIAGANQNFNVTGLQAGTTYYFGIKLFNIAGQASPVVTTSATTLSSGGGGGCSNPPAVSNFSANPSFNSVTLSWLTPLVYNLAEFDIRLSENPINEANFNLAAQIANAPAPIAGQNQTLKVDGLKFSKTYYFAIKLYSICGQASPIATTSATTNSPNLTPPPPVANLRATALNQNTIKLSWTTPMVNNLAEFDIRFSQNEITPNNFNLAAQIQTNEFAPLAGQNQDINITNLQSNTTYYFAIKLFNIVGQESPIATTSARTLSSGGGGGGGCVPPLPVTNFSASGGPNYIDISWTTPNIPNLAEFDIRQSQNEITPINFNLAAQIANAPAPIAGQNQSLRVSGLANNTRYYFAIKLYNICGQASTIATTSAVTQSVGGGSSGSGGGPRYTMPTNLSIFINDNASTTTTTTVRLTLYATNANEMAISNSYNFYNFKEVNWEPYKTSKDWTLTPGEGVKRVYAMFRNIDNRYSYISEIISDDIIYELPKNQPAPPLSQLPLQKQESPLNSFGLVDFNTLMINWGDSRIGDSADFNKDGKIDLRDVLILSQNWVDINIKNNKEKTSNTNLLLTPTKVKIIKGKDITFLVNISPLENRKNYTARIQINYPKDFLELKSFTYWNNWVPIIRPGYDEHIPEKGIILKTAGYQKGFSDEKLFGVITFTAKKPGQGLITFNGDSSFVINANNENTLSGVSFPNVVSIESLNGSYQRGFLYASLLTLAEKGKFITFLAIFAILLALYILYKFLYYLYLQRGEKKDNKKIYFFKKIVYNKN